jgi:hypothetical protein
VYRDLGTERSLARVAEITGRPRGSLGHYSTRFRWPARAEAWDDALFEAADRSYLAAAGRINAGVRLDPPAGGDAWDELERELAGN